ncbi:MAG: hypothetical protein WB507_09345 [Solirubrobacterales bacterium]
MRDERVRLIALLLVLVTLGTYAATDWTGIPNVINGPSASKETVQGCPPRNTPAVETIPGARLLRLREGLRRIVFFASGLRLYESGLVGSGTAWSDSEPGTQRSLPPSSREPGGYELRWWMPSGDDLAAAVMEFANPWQARDFFKHASSSQCRQDSAAFAATFPPGGRNLEWRNPDGFAQEDLYLLRDRRVYRVGVVKAGVGSRISLGARDAAFSMVNGLACALPDAACHLPSRKGAPVPMRTWSSLARYRILSTSIPSITRQ